MTRKRHTEEQVIAVLKDAQAGSGVQELCRKIALEEYSVSLQAQRYIQLY